MATRASKKPVDYLNQAIEQRAAAQAALDAAERVDKFSHDPEAVAMAHMKYAKAAALYSAATSSAAIAQAIDVVGVTVTA